MTYFQLNVRVMRAASSIIHKTKVASGIGEEKVKGKDRICWCLIRRQTSREERQHEALLASLLTM